MEKLLDRLEGIAVADTEDDDILGAGSGENELWFMLICECDGIEYYYYGQSCILH